MKYRKETRYGFPETRVARVGIKDGYNREPVEVFDMTQFCTRRTHAIRFAKFALRLRQTVDHSISFETTPDAANTLSPGDYIRMGVSVQHQESNFSERLHTGSVAPDGTLQFNEGVNNGTISVFYWKPGMNAVAKGDMLVSNGTVSDEKFEAVSSPSITLKVTPASTRSSRSHSATKASLRSQQPTYRSTVTEQ